MADIRLEGLRKAFGATPVIHGLDLSVADGALCVVVGPSGCGKSTLLRLIAGLETPDAGRIMIGGRDVTRSAPGDRNIAMVFQNYALFPHLTVARNIAFGMEVRGAPRAEIDRRVREAAAILHLDRLLDRKPRQLSGGQRQRVAMGRAIVRDPAAFLFDEPLSNLDAQLRGEMRAEIKRLHLALGATAVHVTHDQVEAMTMGDMLVVMNRGRIEQVGPPMALYERPATTFVARFIGAPPMNLTPAREDTTPFGPASGAAMVGVRPEDLQLCPENPRLRPIVRLVEPLGPDTFAHAEIDGVAITVRLPGSERIAVGDALPLRPHPERLHRFDADGARLG